MIINHKYKFIFIGLPLRASSAISKELIENYNCKSLFHKHSNIPLLKSEHPEIELKNYFIFAVYRDPVQIAFSSFNKLLTNPHGIFTNPKYFAENGGFVNIKRRRKFHEYKSRKIDFETHLKEIYKFHPYNDNLTVNRNYINCLLDFDNLSNDFEKLLKFSFGIEPKRTLPIYNKSTKSSLNSKISNDTFCKVFEPYLTQNKILTHKQYEFMGISKANKILFDLYSKYKAYKSRKYDQRKKTDDSSIHDLKNER